MAMREIDGQIATMVLASSLTRIERATPITSRVAQIALYLIPITGGVVCVFCIRLGIVSGHLVICIGALPAAYIAAALMGFAVTLGILFMRIVEVSVRFLILRVRAYESAMRARALARVIPRASVLVRRRK